MCAILNTLNWITIKVSYNHYVHVLTHLKKRTHGNQSIFMTNIYFLEQEQSFQYMFLFERVN